MPSPLGSEWEMIPAAQAASPQASPLGPEWEMIPAASSPAPAASQQSATADDPETRAKQWIVSRAKDHASDTDYAALTDSKGERMGALKDEFQKQFNVPLPPEAEDALKGSALLYRNAQRAIQQVRETGDRDMVAGKLVDAVPPDQRPQFLNAISELLQQEQPTAKRGLISQAAQKIGEHTLGMARHVGRWVENAMDPEGAALGGSQFQGLLTETGDDEKFQQHLMQAFEEKDPGKMPWAARGVVGGINVLQDLALGSVGATAEFAQDAKDRSKLHLTDAGVPDDKAEKYATGIGLTVGAVMGPVMHWLGGGSGKAADVAAEAVERGIVSKLASGGVKEATSLGVLGVLDLAKAGLERAGMSDQIGDKSTADLAKGIGKSAWESIKSSFANLPETVATLATIHAAGLVRNAHTDAQGNMSPELQAFINKPSERTAAAVDGLPPTNRAGREQQAEAIKRAQASQEALRPTETPTADQTTGSPPKGQESTPGPAEQTPPGPPAPAPPTEPQAALSQPEQTKTSPQGEPSDAQQVSQAKTDDGSSRPQSGLRQEDGNPPESGQGVQQGGSEGQEGTQGEQGPEQVVPPAAPGPAVGEAGVTAARQAVRVPLTGEPKIQVDPTGHTQPELLEAGRQAHPHEVQALVEHYTDNPLAAPEDRHIATLTAEMKRAGDALQAAVDSGDEAGALIANNRRREVAQIIDRGLTADARALAWAQANIKDNWEIGHMLDERETLQGRPNDKEDMAEVAKIRKDYVDAQKAVDDSRAEDAQAAADKVTQATIDEVTRKREETKENKIRRQFKTAQTYGLDPDDLRDHAEDMAKDEAADVDAFNAAYKKVVDGMGLTRKQIDKIEDDGGDPKTQKGLDEKAPKLVRQYGKALGLQAEHEDAQQTKDQVGALIDIIKGGKKTARDWSEHLNDAAIRLAKKKGITAPPPDAGEAWEPDAGGDVSFEFGAGEKPLEPHVQSLVERFDKWWQPTVDAARSRLRDALSGAKSFSGIDPQVLSDLAIVGADYIKRGINTLSRWTAEMVKEFGEPFREHAPEVWAAADKELDTNLEKFGKESKKEGKKTLLRSKDPDADLKNAVRSKKAPMTSEERMTAMREKLAERIENKPAVNRVVQQLMREYAAQGVDNVKDMYHAIQKEMVAIDPEWTYRQTIEAVAGKGEFRPASTDKVDVIVSDMRRQSQAITKRSAIRRKEPVGRFGAQRQLPSSEARKLERQVQIEARRYGVVLTDETSQQRTQLQSLKTASEHRTSDMQDALDKGSRIPVNKKPKPTDEELQALLEKEGMTREQYNTKFGLDMEIDRLEARKAKAQDLLKRAQGGEDIWQGRAKTPKQRNEHTAALQAEVDATNAELKAAKSANAGAQARRAQVQEEAIRERIGAIQEQLASGKLPEKEAKPGEPVAPQVEAARAELEQWQKRLKAAQKARADAEKAIWESEGGALEQRPRLSSERQLEIAIKSKNAALLRSISDYLFQKAENNFAPKEKKAEPAWPQRTLDLMKQRDKARDARDEAKLKWQKENAGFTERWLNRARKAMRLPYLLYSTSLAKLSAACFLRFPEALYDETVATGLRFSPYRKLMKDSPNYGGGDYGAVFGAMAKGLTKGFYNSFESAILHRSQFSRYPKESGVINYLVDMPGSVHDAIKAPAARMAFENSLAHTLHFYGKRGYDIGSAEVLEPAMAKATLEALRAKLSENNVVLDAQRLVAKYLDAKTTGLPVVQTVETLVQPIARVPYNFTGQALERIFGSIYGTGQYVNMLMKGWDKFTYDEKDLVARHIVKGVGGVAGLALFGFLANQYIGGLHQFGDKKLKDDELPKGQIGPVPPIGTHNPGAAVVSFGAQVYKNYEKHQEDGDSPLYGVPASVAAALMGLVDELPPFRTAQLIERLHTPKGMKDFAEAAVTPGFIRMFLTQSGDAAAAKSVDKDVAKAMRALSGKTRKRSK